MGNYLLEVSKIAGDKNNVVDFATCFIVNTPPSYEQYEKWHNPKKHGQKLTEKEYKRACKKCSFG